MFPCVHLGVFHTRFTQLYTHFFMIISMRSMPQQHVFVTHLNEHSVSINYHCVISHTFMITTLSIYIYKLSDRAHIHIYLNAFYDKTSYCSSHFYVEAKLIIPHSSYIFWCTFGTEKIRCFYRICAHFMPCWRPDIISFITHYFAITI